MDRERAVGERRLDAGERPQRSPGDRDVRLFDALDRLARADKRTSTRAKTGWSLVFGKIPKEFSPGTSAAVTIASSPGQLARKASRSPNTKAARACGERTTRSHRESAGASSAPNLSVPATFAQPSRRGRRAPTLPSPGWERGRGEGTPVPAGAGRLRGAFCGERAPSPPAPLTSGRGETLITASTIFT
jgi:hypothetical protein